jgi:hypothetical protein
MRTLKTRLEAMEAARQCDSETGDVSDSEEESPAGGEEPAEESAEVRLSRSVFGSGSRPRTEIPTDNGSLEPEELIDWINSLDKYFDYEDMDEDK